MANSPKLIDVPPFALPPRSGWCCLRCLTRRGMSMAQLSVFSVAVFSAAGASTAGVSTAGVSTTGASTAGVSTLGARGPPAALLTVGERLEGRTLGARTADVTLVDPDLHADAAEGRAGLVDAVVDVRAERVQRHTTLAVELRPAHLRAAEATRALHPDALDLRAALRRLHRLAHGTAEADPAGELLGDALGDELRIRLGGLD